MSRLSRRSWRLLCAVCCLGCLADVRVKADSPLSFIPEDATFVVRFKSPDAMVQRAAKWFPAKMQEVARQELAEAIATCGNDVGSAQEWWGVAFLSSMNDRAYAFILKTKDLKAAKKEHIDSHHIVINDWHVFVDSNETAERLKGCRWGKLKSLASTMNPTSRQLFEKGGTAAFFNVPKLRAAYGPVWETFKKSIWENLQLANRPAPAQAPAGQKPGQPPPPDAVVSVCDPKAYEALVNIWQGVVHLLEEAETVTVSLTIDDKGAELQSYVAVVPNSPTAQFLARHPASEMKPLGHLPSSALAYFGFSGELTEFSRWMAQWFVSSLDRPLAQRQVIEQKLRTLPLEKIDGYYGSFAFSEDMSPPFLAASAIETNQPQQVRKFESAVIELTNTARVTKDRTVRPVVVQQNAETIARQPVDLAVMEVPKDANPTNIELSHALLEACWGSSTRYETRLATVPGAVLQSTGGGRPAMLSLIHSFESNGGAATQVNWRSTRARCGSKANFVCLLDLGRCAFTAAKAFAILPGAGGDPTARSSFEKLQTEALELFRMREASYSGIAVAFEPHVVRFRLYIPREQVGELFELYQLATDAFEDHAPSAKPAKTVPEE